MFKNRLLAVLIVLLISPYIYAENEYWKSSESLIDNINFNGPDKTVRELYDSEEGWSYVIKNIETGAEDWINVAASLHAGSDAGTTSELHDALFSAMKNNPEYMLLEGILVCDGRHDPLSNYKDAMTEVQNTINALNKVKVGKLKSDIEFCTNALERSKEDLKRFFGVSE